jgi:hypothetical protein
MFHDFSNVPISSHVRISSATNGGQRNKVKFRVDFLFLLGFAGKPRGDN